MLPPKAASSFAPLSQWAAVLWIVTGCTESPTLRHDHAPDANHVAVPDAGAAKGDAEKAHSPADADEGPDPDAAKDPYPYPAIAGELKAAPGLQGHGTDSAAGRGGRVLVITNLADSGPGSARAALEASGPRQIISNVAGEVTLLSPIRVRSECSYYGQAAPGEGLTFVMDHPSYVDAAIVIDGSHDVLIQHMRVRGIGGGVYRNLIVMSSQRVTIDHSSFSWSTDQNLNSWFVNDALTFSNNMTYEGLLGPKNETAKPTLFGFTGSTGISIHHNVMAHGLGRMPQVANFQDYSVEWNLIHNAGNWATSIVTQGDGTARVQGNVAHNWYRMLQNTNPIAAMVHFGAASGPIDAFVEGNYLANTDAAVVPSGTYTGLGARHPTPLVTDPATVRDLPQTLLPHAGASLPARDKNDARIVAEVLANTGAWVSDLLGQGGPSQTYLPPASVGSNPAIDHQSVDGIPDAWKTNHGLAAGADLTQQDSNGDGYTDWEDWRIAVFGG